MAEANTTPSAPAPEAGEASAERAPAEVQAGPQESATEPSKENAENEANGADEKPAGKCSFSLFLGPCPCLSMPDGDRVHLCVVVSLLSSPTNLYCSFIQKAQPRRRTRRNRPTPLLKSLTHLPNLPMRKNPTRVLLHRSPTEHQSPPRSHPLSASRRAGIPNPN